MVRDLKPHRRPPGWWLGLGLVLGTVFWWGTYKLLEQIVAWLTLQAARERQRTCTAEVGVLERRRAAAAKDRQNPGSSRTTVGA